MRYRVGLVRRRWFVDVLAVLFCLAWVPVVHDLVAVVRTPFWLDEAWVAVSDKASLGQLPWVTASTPIGWTFLVWLFPAGAQHQRVVPLAFLAGSVAAGYAFGRALAWPGRGLGVLAGMAGAAAALLLPAQQVRHDFKQYTADACLAVLLLAVLAWTESDWSPRRGLALAGFTVGGMFFSHPLVFVGAAALGGLIVVAAVQRAWPRLRALLALTGLTGAGMLAVYLVFDRPTQNGELTSYWAAYFPSLGALPRYVVHRMEHLRQFLGMPWLLFLALAAIGVVTVFRRGRPATAVALALMPLIAVAAGVLRVYPLLDQRTSHFLLVTAAVVGAVGVVDLAAGLARLPLRRPTGTRVPVLIAGALCAIVLAGFLVANRAWWRYPYPSGEDVRSQVAYVAEHRAPGDVILMNDAAAWGFAYYWSAARPTFVHSGAAAIGWYLTYPDSARATIAPGKDYESIRQALLDAAMRALPNGRLWLIRTHLRPEDISTWQRALQGFDVHPVRVGREPVLLVDTLPLQQLLRMGTTRR